MDLGTFYREFQNPPQLSSLSIDIGAQSMAEDLVCEQGMANSAPFHACFLEQDMREDLSNWTFDSITNTVGLSG